MEASDREREGDKLKSTMQVTEGLFRDVLLQEVALGS